VGRAYPLRLSYSNITLVLQNKKEGARVTDTDHTLQDILRAITQPGLDHQYSSPCASSSLASVLYNLARASHWIFPHTSPLRYSIINGMDLGYTACLATRLRPIPHGDRDDHIAMIARFIDQMKNQEHSDCRYFPKFIAFTVLNDTFNLWFEAERGLLDYFSHKSPAVSVAGYSMLINLIAMMEHYWMETGMVTRWPNMALCFKRPGYSVDYSNVCFLQSHLVPLNSEFSNKYQCPWLPRDKDIATFIGQCTGRSNADINISVALTVFFLQVIHREFLLPWDSSTQDVYIATKPDEQDYVSLLLAKSKVLFAEGRNNNVTVQYWKTLLSVVQTGALTEAWLAAAFNPTTLVA
jgi:hypothetical protein